MKQAPFSEMKAVLFLFTASQTGSGSYTNYYSRIKIFVKPIDTVGK